MQNIEDVVSTVRKNILHRTYQAGRKGAHVAPSLSLAEILSVLFAEFFDFDQDKFILSKGHGGLGYYCALHAVHRITDEQLETFETNGGDFPGQPSRQPGNGILYSSGSLGLGLAYGVGHSWSMKLGQEPGQVVVLLGDGELNEGSVWESAMLASQQKLSNLTAIVDWNGMQSDGRSEDIIYMDLEKIWSAFGWHVIVCDGHDIAALRSAYAERTDDRPKVILAKTVKGKGVSFMEGNRAWHHGHLSEEQYAAALREVEGNDGIQEH